jgi:hypothetical protein
VQDGIIQLPDNPSKDYFRALNELAPQKKLDVSGPGAKPYEDRLIRYLANGDKVVPIATHYLPVAVASVALYI